MGNETSRLHEFILELLVYGVTTQGVPLGKDLTNQNVKYVHTWEKRIAIFFSNKPITLKNMNYSP